MRCHLWLTILATIPVALCVQAQASRAVSAASYLDRGNAWLSKGELDPAIADYDNDTRRLIERTLPFILMPKRVYTSASFNAQPYCFSNHPQASAE